MKKYEDELICDLAETYHIYDYKSLDVLTLATFCVGLGENARINQIQAGLNCSFTNYLLARISDEIAIQNWLHSVDGQKEKNRPGLISTTLIKKDESGFGFKSADEFEVALEKIREGG